MSDNTAPGLSAREVATEARMTPPCTSAAPLSLYAPIVTHGARWPQCVYAALPVLSPHARLGDTEARERGVPYASTWWVSPEDAP